MSITTIKILGYVIVMLGFVLEAIIIETTPVSPEKKLFIAFIAFIGFIFITLGSIMTQIEKLHLPFY
jgi:hypothetical protein